MSATNRMTDQEIADFIANYITGKNTDKIAAMIYDAYGQPEDEGDPGYPEIPKGGIVEKFVDADYGEIVREDIVKLTLLLKGYFGKTASDVDDVKTEIEAIIDQAVEDNYRSIVFNGSDIEGWEHLYVGPSPNFRHHRDDEHSSMSASSPMIAADGIKFVKYTGLGTNTETGGGYGIYLVEYTGGAESSCVNRTQLFINSNPDSRPNVELREDCKYIRFMMYCINEISLDARNDFSADLLMSTSDVVEKESKEVSDAVFGPMKPIITYLIENMGVYATTGRIRTSRTIHSATPAINVSGHRYIRYTRITWTEQIDYGLAFYTEGFCEDGVEKIAEAERYFVSGVRAGINRNGRASYDTIVVEVPPDAVWAKFDYWGSPETYNSVPFQAWFVDDYDLAIGGKTDGLLKGSNAGLYAQAKALGLHTVPESEGILNIIRRVRQLTDIEWTPAVDLPRLMMLIQSPSDAVPAISNPYYLGVFKGGVTYKGIPYNRTRSPYSTVDAYFPANEYGRRHLYVGHKGWNNGGVDIATFITSAENGNSRLCMDFNTTREMSGGNPTRNNVLYHLRHNPLFLGGVCSTMGSYAFNLSDAYVSNDIYNHGFTPIPSSHFVQEEASGCVIVDGNTYYILEGVLVDRDGSEFSGEYSVESDKVIVTEDGVSTNYAILMCDAVQDLSYFGEIDKLEIGFLVNGHGIHTAVCTDLQRDEEGHIVYVEISDATPVGAANPDLDGGLEGGVCRRKGYTVEEFAVKFRLYNLYRFDNADDVPYEPCPYVNVGDEYEWLSPRDLPIIPYEGDGFSYRIKTSVSPNEIYAPGGVVKLIFSNSKTDPWTGEETVPFTHIRLWKNDVVFGNDISISGSDTFKNLTLSDLSGTGHYKASLIRLDNGTVKEMSAKCSFDIE